MTNEKIQTKTLKFDAKHKKGFKNLLFFSTSYLVNCKSITLYETKTLIKLRKRIAKVMDYGPFILLTFF